MRLFLAVLTFLAVSTVTGGPMMGEFAAQAGEHSEGLRSLIEAVKREKALSDAGHDKLGSALSSVLDRIEARGITRANARAMNAQALSNPLVRLDTDANIQVYIHLTDLASPALAQLRSREAVIQIANEQLGIVQAWVPFDRIEEIAALPFVTRVTPPSYGRARAGSKTTEGDSILKADQLRALGVDGSGVKVGIISDGANNWAQSQASGDLPASGITLFGSCTPSPRDITICSPRLTCNEGTAMAEIVHDIAPGAEIAVGSGISTSLAFIARVNDLANTFGADIIVDDLGFFGDPYFEDGPVAQAVAAVKDQVVFVSSAGNAAQRHYEADYRDSTNLHDFGLRAGGSSDLTMNVLIGAGEFLVTVLQWNDRFDLSANDYDLFVLNEAETIVIASSQGFQTGTQDPIEATCVFNPTALTARAKVVVLRFSGAIRRLEMFPLGSIFIEEYGVPGDSIFGHPAVTGVLATAAIDASDPGNDTIEPFSSRGPSTIFFPSFESRPKPDLAGIDGVSVTGTGGFPGTFFGTSAAAPHVAGIAALLKQTRPSASPAKLRQVLKDGAVDLGAAGPDSIFGWGRVDAIAAHDLLRPKALPWLQLLLE